MQRLMTLTPDLFDLPYEEVTLTTVDAVRLSAWFVPSTRVTHPPMMAVLHHHFAGQKAALLPWAELLHTAGVSVLAFDARNHARSTVTNRSAYRDRFHDVHAALAFLRDRGAQHIIALGQSQGCAVVAGAVFNQADVCAVIFDSGPAAFAPPSHWGLARTLVADERERSRGTPHVNTPYVNTHVATALTALRLTRQTKPGAYAVRFWRSMHGLRRKRLLWTHGTNDRVIPRIWSSLWFHTLRGPGWESLSVDGSSHLTALSDDPMRVNHAVQAFLGHM